MSDVDTVRHMEDALQLHGPEHVRRYLETDGAVGYYWRRDSEILILTTVGRVTGQLREHALIFREDGGRYVVVASKGGADEHPQWYRNLRADPNVQVQIRADRFSARARTATANERSRLWRLMTEVWPDYDAFQARTSREIPVVILERIFGA